MPYKRTTTKWYPNIWNHLRSEYEGSICLSRFALCLYTASFVFTLYLAGWLKIAPLTYSNASRSAFLNQLPHLLFRILAPRVSVVTF